jgi:hypothetical protein
MMGEVIDGNFQTTLPIDPDKVLAKAIGELNYVLVLGYQKDGSFYMAVSESEAEKAVFTTELFKHKILSSIDE